MAIDEATRHAIHDYFIGPMGPDLAAALMTLLPPVGWADIATKHDVAAVRQDIAALETALRADFRAELADALRRQTMWVTTVMTAGFAASIGAMAALVGLT